MSIYKKKDFDLYYKLTCEQLDKYREDLKSVTTMEELYSFLVNLEDFADKRLYIVRIKMEK